MKPFPLLALGLAASLALAGCKIVKNEPEGEKAIAADASGDDARTAQRIADTFESKLLPLVNDTALPLPDLRKALAGGLDAAGKAHGNRGAGAGAAWNFAVKGEGKVVSAKLDSRARWIGLDTDGDNQQDVTVQLGPVIKGSAMRDIAAFYNFDDFRDQIEFAKLGRAINDELSKRISVPDGDLTGRTVRFTGVVPLKKADEEFTVTPSKIEVLP
ncbi:DUF2291 family protein [Roseibium suaedae]|uniref:Predicted lipoprotein n=1 Tax=Roseibium suaedae TaxID=735517 RepID=A0A1M7F250_9HYPH|nr:DUF2291 domain-containing protein [Roseibium suaedae]SHL98125.1 Predicted lipoprotein [Roseibium suaedae]